MLPGPVAMHVANETYLTLHDPRHNLLSIADSTGTVAAGNSLRYEPFGTPSVGATTSGIEPRFGGMRYLPGTQLYLSDTRLMDPRHGAWLSPDPLGYVDSPNLYAYARQNPIDFVDPSGLGTKKGKTGKNSDGGDIFDWFAEAKETLAEGIEDLMETAEDSFNFYKGLVTSEEFTGFWRGFGKRSLEIAGVSLFGMGVRTPWTTQTYLKESQQNWEGIKAGAELFTTAWDASWGDESAELRRQEMVGAIVNNFATMSPEEWGSMAPDVLLGMGTGGAGAGVAVGRGVVSTGRRSLSVLGRVRKAVPGEAMKPIVIGERMGSRVIPFADKIGAETIKDFLNNRAWTQELNDEFILKTMAEGRDVLDVGPDFDSRLLNRVNPMEGQPPSPFYGRERMQLAEYDRLRKVFQRSGKFQGGVQGLDF